MEVGLTDKELVPRVYPATCLDLSVGGVLCQTEEKLTRGSVVSLRIQLDESEEVLTKGKVVRVERVREVDGYRIAFEFVERSPKLVERLTYFLLYPRNLESFLTVTRVRRPFEM